jgi:hypothetical protein
MREGLAHTHSGLDDSVFFQMIDETGGWPVGLKYVGFEHTSSRNAGFTNSQGNTGWWTVIASADDYYLWKLSPEALQRVVNSVVAAVRLSTPAVGTFPIRGSMGSATIRKPAGGAA